MLLEILQFVCSIVCCYMDFVAVYRHEKYMYTIALEIS